MCVCVCVWFCANPSRRPLARVARHTSRLPPWQVLGTTIYFIIAQKSKVKKQVVELKVLSKFDRASAEAAPTLRADSYEARMLLCVWLGAHIRTHIESPACVLQLRSGAHTVYWSSSCKAAVYIAVLCAYVHVT